MKIVVTGGTGFLGHPLCVKLIQAGNQVTNLSRDPNRSRAVLGDAVRHLAWGRSAPPDWQRVVADADVVVHLAGESVGAERWTPEFKARIRASRIESTRELVAAIGSGECKPGALICASAVGYYGDRQDERITEQSPAGKDFLAAVCVEWEDEAHRAEAFGYRVVTMRTGIVMGQGGALEKLMYPFPLPISPWKLGVGGPMGSGKQWMPWIHQEDAVGLFEWALQDNRIRGPVNVTAPVPVTNREFVQTLGRILHRPAVLPLPAFALRALLGEFADSLLGGQRAIPEVAEKCGYRFHFAELEKALQELLKK